jgi:hypothetical protein
MENRRKKKKHRQEVGVKWQHTKLDTKIYEAIGRELLGTEECKTQKSQ